MGQLKSKFRNGTTQVDEQQHAQQPVTEQADPVVTEEPMEVENEPADTEPGPSGLMNMELGMARVKYTRQADGRYKCGFCDITQSSKSNITRHCRVHVDPMLPCLKGCGKKFHRPDIVAKHTKNCTGPARIRACMACKKVFTNKKAYERHMDSGEHRAAMKPKRPCNSCKKPKAAHAVKGVPAQLRDEDPTKPVIPPDASPELEEEIRRRWNQIRTCSFTSRKCCKFFNVRLRPGYNFEDIMVSIFDMMDNTPFKVSVEAGFMLERSTMEEAEGSGPQEKREFKFFYPGRNTNIVKTSKVWDRPSLDTIMEKYNENFMQLDKIMNVLPDSKWGFHDMMSVLISIFPTNDYNMIGMINDEAEVGPEDQHREPDEDPQDPEEQAALAEYIRLSKSVKSLTHDTNRRRYTDRLCVFRVIADKLKEAGLQQGSLQEVTLRLWFEWAQSKYQDFRVPDDYEGTADDDLPEIEKFFGVRLNVFGLRYKPQRQQQQQQQQHVHDDDIEDEADLIRQAEADPNREANLDLLLRTADEDALDEVELNPVRRDVAEPQDAPMEVDQVEPAREIEGVLLRRTLQSTGVRVDALLHNGHFHRVTKVEALVKSWRCVRCGRYFDRHSNANRHSFTCSTELKREYPETGYTLDSTVFKRLREAGYQTDDHFFDYWIIFDFESRFEEIPPAERETSLKFLKKLIPLSVSTVTNFKGPDGTSYDTPKFMHHRDPKVLVREFYRYLQTLATEIGSRKKAEFQDALDFAKARAVVYRQLINELKEQRGHEDESVLRAIRNKMALAREDAKTYAMLKRWVTQIPVIGFNSGRFDVNLVREFLLPEMLNNSDEDKVTNIIERGTDFMAISTTKLLFLDMMHYLPPGVSLDLFIRSYNPDANEAKYFFPYEYIDSYDRLLEGFPPKQAFYSSLKKKHISQENYDKMKQLYQERNCRNLLEFLQIYNDQDVAAFLRAVEAMFNIFKGLQLDMFKSNCISLPGLAMRRMFSRQGTAIVPLFNQRFSYWHTLIKENIVGGPAIVFTRAMKEGNCIRGSQAVCGNTVEERSNCRRCRRCKRILGFDANSLYLFCTGRPMPVGIPRIYTPRDAESEEVPVLQTEGVSKEECLARVERNMGRRFSFQMGYKSMYEVPWVLSEFERLKDENPQIRDTLTVHHQMNGGQRFFLSENAKHRIYADGYVPELRTVIEYNGCWHHGHACPGVLDRITASPDPVQEEYERRQRFQKTQWRVQEMEKQGLVVRTKWECDRPLEDPYMQQAVKEVIPKLTRHNPTARSLLKDVQDDQFFGVMHVDLQVPWWNPALRDRMAELPPIFKNTSISREDVGEYMKQFAEATKVFKQPRRSLVSSYHGTNICLISPMIKYLMKLGVVVTRLHQAIQYVSNPLFNFITEEVTEARIRADQAQNDRAAVALGNVQKLIGNSCYGKCLTNVEAHQTVKLMGELEAGRAINDPLFTKLDPVDDDNYLVHFSKNSVMHNLPILVAFWVYGYAKLRMIEFYFDFLLKHLGPEKMQLVQMDTDSMYFACSEESLDAAASGSPGYAADKAKFIEGPDTKRVPGLFKLEWSGKAMIALNPKCYYGLADPGKDKISMKGVSHVTNRLSYDEYESVLDRSNVDPVMATNNGFRRMHGHLEQYQLTKVALTHLYIKRKVLDNQLHNTVPLDL